MTRIGVDAAARRIVGGLLAHLDGGSLELTDRWGTECFAARRPGSGNEQMHAVVRVHDARLYARVLREGSVGLGEAYADGWWDADDVTTFLRLAHRSLSRTHELRDRARRIIRPVIDPFARLRPARPPARPQEHPRALRPRQRAVPAPARRVDDVLLRGLRIAERLARGGVAGQARSTRPDPGAVTGRPGLGDRYRVGRVRDPRRRARTGATSPRRRSRTSSTSSRGPGCGPRAWSISSRCARTTTATSTTPSTSWSRSR